MSTKKAEPRKSHTRRKATLNPDMTYQITKGQVTITLPGVKIADLVFEDFLSRHGKQEALPLSQPENEKP